MKAYLLNLRKRIWFKFSLPRNLSWHQEIQQGTRGEIGRETSCTEPASCSNSFWGNRFAMYSGQALPMCLDVSGCGVLSAIMCHQNALQMSSHHIMLSRGPSNTPKRLPGCGRCDHLAPPCAAKLGMRTYLRSQPADCIPRSTGWVLDLFTLGPIQYDGIADSRGEGLKLEVEQRKLQMVHTSGTDHLTHTECVAKSGTWLRTMHNRTMPKRLKIWTLMIRGTCNDIPIYAKHPVLLRRSFALFRGCSTTSWS